MMGAKRKPRSFFPPDDQSTIAKWDRAMAFISDCPTFFGVERTLDADRETGQEIVPRTTHPEKK